MATTPDTPDPLITRLRQQLLLAQVRIMELEDSRDETAPKLEQIETLLGEAQLLAERKIEEAAHLENVRSELQAQYTHLQHVQHVTHTALEAVRDEISTKDQRIESLLQETELLQKLIQELSSAVQNHLEYMGKLESELADTRVESAAHVSRIKQLDSERNDMKATRSWRWTAWLRALERRLR
jgi:chromosome segregation ATPase